MNAGLCLPFLCWVFRFRWCLLLFFFFFFLGKKGGPWCPCVYWTFTASFPRFFPFSLWFSRFSVFVTFLSFFFSFFFFFWLLFFFSDRKNDLNCSAAFGRRRRRFCSTNRCSCVLEHEYHLHLVWLLVDHQLPHLLPQRNAVQLQSWRPVQPSTRILGFFLRFLRHLSSFRLVGGAGVMAPSSWPFSPTARRSLWPPPRTTPTPALWSTEPSLVICVDVAVSFPFVVLNRNAQAKWRQILPNLTPRTFFPLLMMFVAKNEMLGARLEPGLLPTTSFNPLAAPLAPQTRRSFSRRTPSWRMESVWELCEENESQKFKRRKKGKQRYYSDHQNDSISFLSHRVDMLQLGFLVFIGRQITTSKHSLLTKWKNRKKKKRESKLPSCIRTLPRQLHSTSNEALF